LLIKGSWIPHIYFSDGKQSGIWHLLTDAYTNEAVLTLFTGGVRAWCPLLKPTLSTHLLLLFTYLFSEFV
jgi:hypothetical protein